MGAPRVRVDGRAAAGIACACSRTPIDSSPVLADAGRMHTPMTPPLPAGPHKATATLVDIEEALAAVDRSCALVASALLPQGDGICDRYRRAAARWPHTLEPPSRERQAAIQSALHETAASVHSAARSCRRARELLGGPGA